MMHVVVKRFSWCPDGSGITSEDLKPGDERDFGETAESLAAERYIEPVKAKQAPAAKQKAGDAA